MTTSPHSLQTPPSSLPARRTASRVWRILGGLALLFLLIVGGLLWYASTDQFVQRVRRKVVSTLEDATGGKVDLRRIHWNLRHLSVEADDLTIHGLEGPGEVPYAHVDRFYARAKIISLFHADIGLNYLELDHPVIHLIIYPDGSTNQPRPKTVQKSNKSVVDTVFDLAVDRAEVNDGIVLLNQRAIPFNIAGNGLGVLITYTRLTDRYHGTLRIADITAQRGKLAPIHSQLQLSVDAARNAAQLEGLSFITGGSRLDASGSVANYANPQWKLAAKGAVDLREVVALAPIDGLGKGTVELSLQGQGGGGPATATSPPLAPFVVDGNVRLVDAGYHTKAILLDGLNATTSLHLTQDELALPDLKARLRQGGTVNAGFRLLNWLTPSPSTASAAAPTARARRGAARTAAPALVASGSLRARIAGIRLRTALEAVAPRKYQDLGFDTAAEGTLEASWTGSAADLTAAARLTLTPPAPPALGEVPLTGVVDARYFARGSKVQINQFDAHTPAAQISLSGALGLGANGPSQLQVNLATSNLAEFDRLLTEVGVASNGKKGVAAIPVQLHGQAQFHGTVNGTLADPDVKGHLTATQFATVIPASAPAPAAPGLHRANAPAPANQPSPPAAAKTTTIQWDRLDADAEYSPERMAVQQATLTRGKTVIHASGQLRGHRLSAHRIAFDDLSPLDATATMQDASLSDLLNIAGQTLPATGTVNLRAHAGGTLGSLNGGGHLTVLGGDIEGEPYRSLNADLAFAGHNVNVPSLTFLVQGATLQADAGYNLDSKAFHLDATGSNFELARFKRLQSPRAPIAGQLTFDAHGTGTVETPAIDATARLQNLVLGGQPMGSIETDARTRNGVLFLTTHSNLSAARLDLSGQTVLKGDFATQAKLVFSNLDIGPFLEAFKMETVAGHSAIGGTITVNGPAKEPKRLNGEANIDQFSVTAQNITLQSKGPLLASLRDGVLRLTQAEITGPDTDLNARGSADLLGAQALDVHANGAVNVKLAQTFDPNITSSGHVDFDVAATGTIKQPSLGGQIKLTNVALAMNTLPNGLSKLNGTLVFDQNRLQIKDMVGQTGGGQLRLGGYIAYQQGLYADLSATGKDIRVRYSGISATADTALRLQGTQNNLLLSGNIQINRFMIGPNLDLASFAGPAAATPPPDASAPTNHIRLDVHVVSAPQLDFQNSYAQLAGSVDLHVRGTVAQPAILGRITITDGTATFNGATYQLQHGDIYFTNPVRIEPVIDLDATTRVEEYQVTLGLHGNASHLTPTFRSEPPLPQADVISLLASGRTQEEQQIYSSEQQQAGVNPTTDAILSGALNATVSSRVKKLFGVGSVKIDPTYVGSLGNSSARITVQQNISQNVQLTYATNVNTTAQQLIQAQVNLTQNVSLLAVRDESDVFSIVLKIHRRYR